MKKIITVLLSVLLIAGLFTGCDGDASEQLLNGAGTEPIVKVTYTSGSSRSAKPETETKIIKVPSRVVLKSFLTDNGIVAEKVTGLEFYGIREIQGNENDGTTFASCENLETVFMDKSLTDIGDYSFYKGTELPLEVLLMEGVERIGKYAFNGCKDLQGVIFPETIKLIDEQAFYGCYGMETIVFTGKTAPIIASDAFKGTDTLQDIIVPAGSSESYKNVLPEELKGRVSEKSVYTITFDANGGTGTMFPETLIEGKTEKLTPCEFTPPEGKVFAGWNEAKDGSGTKYDDEAEITLTSDITLYAQWKDGAAALPYLCFTAEEAGSTVKLSVVGTLATTPTLECSTDGNVWTSYVIGTDVVTLANIGDKVYLRGDNTSFSESTANYLKFEMTGKVAASGNVMSLLDSTCQSEDLTGKDYVFFRLFSGCESLTTAPELPATTLSQNCYDNMFYKCTSLTTAPELLATTLAQSCYCNMFWDCSSLATAPELPATTLAKNCYESMFYGCTSLTTAPVLPAATLENCDNCYANMFAHCTALTTAPDLPATTLANYCYCGMFSGCESLTTVPTELPATTLASYCYNCMFQDCKKITKSPEICATSLATNCCCNMFNGCEKLTEVAVHFTEWSGDATSIWLLGVYPSGTFACPAELAETRGSSYIPESWTIIPIVQGIFSVSTDKKVQFTGGNLQAKYNAYFSSYSWSFTTNQYDYIGNASGNTTIGSQTDGAVVDLFGWSTASTNYGISNSTEAGDYSGEFEDWGTMFGNGSELRSLSKDELSYLLGSRTVNGGAGEGKSYQRAKVNSKNGLIIYPDGYTAQISSSPLNDDWGNASNVNLSAWAAMEASGCVFIPCAHYRDSFNSGDVTENDDTGAIWTSSKDSDTKAYSYTISEEFLGITSPCKRSDGYSVRLVKDVE